MYEMFRYGNNHTYIFSSLGKSGNPTTIIKRLLDNKSNKVEM
mgnify:CR=1 FL=1